MFSQTGITVTGSRASNLIQHANFPFRRQSLGQRKIARAVTPSCHRRVTAQSWAVFLLPEQGGRRFACQVETKEPAPRMGIETTSRSRKNRCRAALIHIRMIRSRQKAKSATRSGAGRLAVAVLLAVALASSADVNAQTLERNRWEYDGGFLQRTPVWIEQAREGQRSRLSARGTPKSLSYTTASRRISFGCSDTRRSSAAVTGGCVGSRNLRSCTMAAGTLDNARNGNTRAGPLPNRRRPLGSSGMG